MEQKLQSTILERLKAERIEAVLKKGDIFRDLDKEMEVGKKLSLEKIEKELTLERDDNPEEEIISVELRVYKTGGTDGLIIINRGLIDIKKYEPLSMKSIIAIIKEYMKSNSLAEVFVGNSELGAFVKYNDFLAELQAQGLSITPCDANTLMVSANLKLEEEQKLTLEP